MLNTIMPSKSNTNKVRVKYQTLRRINKDKKFTFSGTHQSGAHNEKDSSEQDLLYTSL